MTGGEGGSRRGGLGVGQDDPLESFEERRESQVPARSHTPTSLVSINRFIHNSGLRTGVIVFISVVPSLSRRLVISKTLRGREKDRDSGSRSVSTRISRRQGPPVPVHLLENGSPEQNTSETAGNRTPRPDPQKDRATQYNHSGELPGGR